MRALGRGALRVAADAARAARLPAGVAGPRRRLGMRQVARRGSAEHARLRAQHELGVSDRTTSRSSCARCSPTSPSRPAYFARMKRLNAHGVPPMPSPPRADGDLRDRVRDGALVVDTRPSSEFLARHLEGSISLPLGRSFLTYAGSVLDPARELVLLMPADALHEADSVARDLALIGYDRVLGALPADRARGVRAQTRREHSDPLGCASCRLAPAVRPWSTCAPPPSGTRDTSRARCTCRWRISTSQLSELREPSADRHVLPERCAQRDGRERAARRRHRRREQRGRRLRRMARGTRRGRSGAGTLTASGAEPRLRRLVLVGAGRAHLHLLRALSRPIVRRPRARARHDGSRAVRPRHDVGHPAWRVR